MTISTNTTSTTRLAASAGRRSLALAIAFAAGLLLTMSWAAQGRGADGCSAQLDRAQGALASGGKLDAARITSLQGCLASQPGTAAAALAPGQAESATTQSPATQSPGASVLASFQISVAGWPGPLCVKFNSDGTISSTGLYPAGVSPGGYFGTPGAFTLFSLTMNFPVGVKQIAYAGLSIGSVLVALPVGPYPVWIGLQVPSC